jgi:hypothetical protein
VRSRSLLLALLLASTAASTLPAQAARETAAPTGPPPVSLQEVSRPVAVQEGTATVPVRLAFGAPTGLPAGTPVQVEIDAGTRDGVVTLPAAAIIHDGEESAVFVVSEGIAHRRPVAIGIASADRVEVVSGGKAGETVVVGGQNGLPDGAKVAITR